MRKIKKILSIVTVAALMCSTIIIGGCSKDKGKNKNNNSNIDADGNVEYKVTAKDALGKPYTSGVIVKFLQNGSQIAMQVCDATGVATKKLKAGNYDVELSFTDGDDAFHYEKEGLKVTSEKNELDVIVAYTTSDSTEKQVYYNQKDFNAYSVMEGCTYVELDTEYRSFFMFTPTNAGTYEFSIKDGSNVSIGYYGAPHYIQQYSAAEVKDNKFTVSISASMIGTGDTGTTVIVIGVDSLDGAKNCVIGIERIGEPEHTLADEPWTIYKKTSVLSKYTLPTGATINEFDITSVTDAYKLVYSEKDGFYHLNSEDGPLVLVRLAKDPKYVACFKTILDNTGVNKYFYDENGEFVKKESYSECLLEYIECADEKEGLYPLTEDLKYIIQQKGEYAGWFDANSNNYIFKNQDGNKVVGVNTEISWLFMCCYINN